MKNCPTRTQLEAAVLGEVHESRVVDLETHAEGCARCRHELNWLRAEVAMFAQRNAREEVSRLWEGVDTTAVQKARRPMRLARGVLAVAASVLLAVAVTGSLFKAPRGSIRGSHGESLPMSLELMSVEQRLAASGELASMPCYTPGFGIACGELQFASR